MPTPTRNISAHAGKTAVSYTTPWWITEHPRVCGENPWGSSRRRRRTRNIPAYAGKTPNATAPGCMSQEHPRVCGENRIGQSNTYEAHGTSPRMRGKPPVKSPTMILGRNIPAYAGKTDSRTGTGSPAAEHPRVCGENRCTSVPARGFCGTSPRMRGKLRT